MSPGGVAAVAIAIAAAGCSKKSAPVAAAPDVTTTDAEPESDAELAFDELGESGPKTPVVPMPGAPEQPVDATAAPGTKFDRKAARVALAHVKYKDCGTGGLGEMSITFAPDGHVVRAVVTGGIYDAGVVSCLMSAFRSLRVLPFDGEAVTMTWSIEL